MSKITSTLNSIVKERLGAFDEELDERIEKIARKVVRAELEAAFADTPKAPRTTPTGRAPRGSLTPEQKKINASEQQNKFRARAALIDKYGVPKDEAKRLIAAIDTKYTPPERVRIALKQLGRLDAEGKVQNQTTPVTSMTVTEVSEVGTSTLDVPVEVQVESAPMTVVHSLDMDMVPMYTNV